MHSFQQFPLGQPFPPSPHAVASSLPTFVDVCAYEEHEERVLQALDSGYPRFVVHLYVRELLDLYMTRFDLAGRKGFLIPGRRAAQDLSDWFEVGIECLEVDSGLFLVHCDAMDRALALRLRKYVQHVGCGISSRHAEDLLLKNRMVDSIFEEVSFPGNAANWVENELARLIGCRVSDVLVCASGMNAFFAGFSSILEYQRARGRTHWIQLGWLYLDSGCILREFLEDGEVLETCYDASDTEALVAVLQRAGDRLAAVVVECPTNPLAQVAELEKIASMVREQGGLMLVDPTIVSIYNVDLLPFADILVTSLTKYAANEGDVMLGALAVNPSSPHYGDLILRTSRFYTPPYCRDLGRLALELKQAPAVNRKISENSRELVVFLEQHSKVRKVHYAEKSDSFAALQKPGGGGGAIVSIELAVPMKDFYDAIELLKAPSFGTWFTFLSPFMYLAHYDLVTEEEGRAFLREAGIDPDLIRISVGTEPIGEIKTVFKDALAAAGNVSE